MSHQSYWAHFKYAGAWIAHYQNIKSSYIEHSIILSLSAYNFNNNTNLKSCVG